MSKIVNQYYNPKEVKEIVKKAQADLSDMLEHKIIHAYNNGLNVVDISLMLNLSVDIIESVIERC